MQSGLVNPQILNLLPLTCLKFVTGAAESLIFDNFGHKHIGYACCFTSFPSISGYYQYLIWGRPTMLLSPSITVSPFSTLTCHTFVVQFLELWQQLDHPPSVVRFLADGIVTQPQHLWVGQGGSRALCKG